MLEKSFKVALAESFLDCISAVPLAQQSKIWRFVKQFRKNPAGSGINYERIQQARDPNLRSVRIDQAWRGIVLKPNEGNVYVLLWVDTHDEAYAWAVNRTCQIHPETGALQVLPLDISTAAAAEAGPATADPVAGESPDGLFNIYRDRQLLRLGVPEALIPLVRMIRDTVQLDAAAGQLPREAYEALYYLAEGLDYEEACRELERARGDQPVDTGNFAAALENPLSRQRFVVVDNERELEEIIQAPLEKWRVFLHPAQRALVECQWNGPVRVLGGAGTGKTVVAMHRAHYLVSRIFTGNNDRVLFTTFTSNLAADIEANLAKICLPDELARIEIVHLDKWVNDFLRRQGYPYRIAYYGSGAGPELAALWEQALNCRPDIGLPDSFFREEWELVVQAQGCRTLADYYQAERIGRGVALNRKTRKEVWPVFEEYRELLAAKGLRERSDAMCDARQILEEQGDILPYRAVVVDEAQDMSDEAFRLIRQMIPTERKNDLFIVGDAHQRIYNRKVVLGRCGIRIIGRARHLRTNYRTTDEIRRYAVGLLAGVAIDDLDGGADDQCGYKSLLHGEPPLVRNFPAFADEVDAIAAYLSKLDGSALANTCLTARTQRLIDRYEDELDARGIVTWRVSRTHADDRSKPGLRLATMHRVKGLEFERMIVAGVNKGIVPLDAAMNHTCDAMVQVDAEKMERCLLYVALTRAKQEVLVTSFGEASGFLGIH